MAVITSLRRGALLVYRQLADWFHPDSKPIRADDIIAGARVLRPETHVLLLFLLFQALYALTLSGNTFRVPDEFEVYFQVEHFADASDISVPQTLRILRPGRVDGRVTGQTPIFFGKVGRDGKPYAPYGPLAALLALPHHIVARILASLGGVPRDPSTLTWSFLVAGLTSLWSATATALAVAGFYRAARSLNATPRTALGLALVLGGATVLWAYGNSFYTEGWQAAGLIWAAALLLEARACSAADARFKVLAASLLLTMTGLTKMTSLMIVPGFMLAAILDRSVPFHTRVRVVLSVTAAAAVAIATHLAWNGYRFGNIFDFGYDWTETVPDPPPQTFRLGDVPHGLIVFFISPGKSLVLWAPVLLLAMVNLKGFFRKEPAVAAALIATGGTNLIFYAGYLFPEGGYCHGPRFLVPMIPLLLLPAVTRPIDTWPRQGLILCVGVGMVMALLATAVSFLDDQSMGSDLGRGARLDYYDRIEPPPGRSWSRYRVAYLPFVRTLTSGEWLEDRLSRGPDFFPLHLERARRLLPGGRSIPLWLVWLPPLCYLSLLVVSARALLQQWHAAALPGS